MKGLTVVFRGLEHTVDVDVGRTTCNEFLQLLVAALHKADLLLAVHTLKLLVPKKGILQLDKQPQMTLSDAGVASGMRLLLVGSLTCELSAMQAAQQAEAVLRLPSFEHEAARAALRSLPSPADKVPVGRHFFGEFKVLPASPGAPAPSSALRLLHQLAADPAIAAVMEAHGWRVGLLSEMPPEGKVGISMVCVLGYNVNRGQEISLRLRTDDLRGFRKYLRIRETLVHELAHMEWSDHDTNFKALNSQLLKEVAHHDAVSAGGVRRLSEVAAFDTSSSWLGDVEAGDPPAAAPRTLAGRALADAAGGAGAASALQRLHDARSAAAAAALTRWQLVPQPEQPEQPEQPAAPVSTSRAVLQASAAGGAVREAAAAADAGGHGAVGGNSDEAEVDMTGGYDQDPATAAAEQQMTSLGSFGDSAEQQQQHHHHHHHHQQQEAAAEAGMANEQSGQHNMLLTDTCQQQQGHVALGPQQQRIQAQIQVGQDPGLNCEVQLLQDMQQQQQQQQEEEGLQRLAGVAVVQEDDVVMQKLSQAQSLVQQLLQKTADSHGGQQPVEALKAVATLLNNLTGDFQNPRYRRIRISNPTFQRRVVRFPEAMQLLLLAGFHEQSLVWQPLPQQQQQQQQQQLTLPLQQQQQQQSERVLVYTRNDPGLLWLVLSVAHEPSSLVPGTAAASS